MRLAISKRRANGPSIPSITSATAPLTQAFAPCADSDKATCALTSGSASAAMIRLIGGIRYSLTGIRLPPNTISSGLKMLTRLAIPLPRCSAISERVSSAS